MSMMCFPLMYRRLLMTLTQLRTLLAVADTGSVRGASKRLVVSQPAVSGAVASLERELGVKLVRREGRGLRFTPSGLAFVSSVRAALALVDRGMRAAQCIAEPARGSVRIAATGTAAERVLPPLLAQFHHRHQQACLIVKVGNRTTVWQAMRDGEADLAVAGRPPEGLDVQILGLADNRLVVIGPISQARALPPAGGPQPADGCYPAPSSLASLAAMTWLLREEGSGTRDATDELLAQLGLDPPRLILGSNGAIEQAAIAAIGVGLVPVDAVAASLAAGRLAIYACSGTPLARPWHLAAQASALTPTAALAARSMLAAPAGFTPTAEGRRLLREMSPGDW